jgi:Ion channel
MDFQEAIQKIEERGDFNRYAEVKPVFVEQLRTLKATDYTERGLSYYYLLVSYLKAQLVHETEESMDFYEEMDECFKKQEKEYLTHAQKFTKAEVQDYYKLMERCYNSLEFLYERHSFKMRRMAAYERKMYFRKNAFWQRKSYGQWLEYKFLEISSAYGTSLGRWALTTLAFVFIVSFAYMFLDMSVAQDLRMISHDAHWFDYFYFSTIVMTTVGLGDIYPLTTLGKVLTAGEAFFGFLMLGIFIGMLQKRIN